MNKPPTILAMLATWATELTPNGKGKQLTRDQRDDLAATLATAIAAIEAAQPKPRPRHNTDVGSIAQAVKWATESADGDDDAMTFLRRWNEGDTSEYPDYLIWLDRQEADYGTASDLTDPGCTPDRAHAIAKVISNNQLDATTCGMSFLADERAMRFVERHGWPPNLDMLEWVSATARGAGAGYNLRTLVSRVWEDEVPF